MPRPYEITICARLLDLIKSTFDYPTHTRYNALTQTIDC